MTYLRSQKKKIVLYVANGRCHLRGDINCIVEVKEEKKKRRKKI